MDREIRRGRTLGKFGETQPLSRTQLNLIPRSQSLTPSQAIAAVVHGLTGTYSDGRSDVMAMAKSYYQNEGVDDSGNGSAPSKTPEPAISAVTQASKPHDQGLLQQQHVVTGQSPLNLFPVNSTDRPTTTTWPRQTDVSSASRARQGPEPVVGHMGRLVSNDDQVAMFAGSSTGVHFISQAEQQLQMLRIHTDTFPSSVYNLYLHNIWGVPPKDSESQVVAAMISQLPLNAAGILEATIDRWTPLYPVVHKHSTLEAFRRLSENPEHGDPSTLHQVLGLLALGTLGLPGSCVESHQHFLCLSETYYTMASALTNILHERPSLPTLQGLEISQIYLQLSSRYSVASQLGGMATRMAQNLGLHRHSQRFKFDPLETELRRRVWWCQYSLDTWVAPCPPTRLCPDDKPDMPHRFSSAYHGMPRLIRDQDVDTDLPSRVDHDQVSRESVAFPLPGERSQVDTALCLFKLAVIVGEALEKLYSTTRRRGGVTKVNQLQAELTMWERMLPMHKAADPEDDGADLAPVAAIDTFEVTFLRAAFYNATVHVHRPALAFTTADPQFNVSLLACGRASAELIRLSATSVSDSKNDDGPNQGIDAVIIAHLYPNGLHMLWQAGLTLLFARWKGQPIAGDEEDEDLVRSCAETLRHLRAGDASGYVAQCADVLDMLREKTFSAREAQQPAALDQLQWNVWDWPMASALELANTLDAMPMDLQFDTGLGLYDPGVAAQQKTTTVNDERRA
ncbi:3-carboxy-muconate cycloisomerase [Colletotrichum higginsianum IMI 349063]|uniref:3-carboxy-muconate cycloisomerase n=1 Tax=Colletotrichum higginsianum (strain IMI 349063) TaxID=759273 RepID=A0A1B7Y490_COLHI|nr:3-carboxy-muconate cycloisomerase [Colletotrichum higginsianum IMI 349063]OBR06867.1 3-carboxy-muconate cycloisomerase [Colletotrichum higginsianum IMI 349063]